MEVKLFLVEYNMYSIRFRNLSGTALLIKKVSVIVETESECRKLQTQFHIDSKNEGLDWFQVLEIKGYGK